MNNMEKSLKNLFLAAVGGTAMTYDRAQDILDQMIEKGRVSVNEGKELTEDLKRTFKREGRSDVQFSDDSKGQLTEELLTLRQDVNRLTQEVAELRTELHTDDLTTQDDYKTQDV